MLQFRLADSGTLFVDVEIGMPHTGRNNLAETPLLKLVGDIRWLHIAALSGIRSKEVVDEMGQRLYATFFFVEVAFPERTPMAHFGENERFTIVNTLCTHQNATVDGYHFLYPESFPDDKKLPLENGDEALALGVPFVRTSNAFVRMVEGSSWLKKGTPVHAGMDRIPQLSRAPSSYSLMLRANDRGQFRLPGNTFSPLTPGRVRFEYRPQPDRDLNGVGLLYFANYPMVLDLAERALLPEAAIVPLSHDLLDLRTVVSRRSAYLCNIAPSDVVDVQLEAWIENPFLHKPSSGSSDPIRLFLNYEMFRRSDGRKMMVSTAEKVIHGTSPADAGLMDALHNQA